MSTPASLPADAGTIAGLVEEQAPGVARRIAQDWELSDRMLRALEEQTAVETPAQPSPLGASLRFGRYCGAIAVLKAVGVLDEQAGVGALHAGAYGRTECERILARLQTRAKA